MLTPLVRTLTPTVAAVVTLTTVLGAALGHAGPRSIAHGATAGALLGFAVAVHVVARTLARRTPEARGSEFSDGSVEQAAVRAAAAPALFDALSIGALASVVGVLTPGSAPALLPLVTCLVLIDFACRAWRARTELMPRG